MNDLQNAKTTATMREIKFKVWDNVDYMSNPFTLQEGIKQ